MWWEACPQANLGLVTGRGVLVLDADPRNGGSQSLHDLVERHGPLPATPTANTGGGGWHHHLAIDGEFPCRTGLARGLDVKADGGYVVAPPSVHASGAPYAWVRGKGLDDLPLAAAPTWLLDAVSGTASKGRKGRRITTGERNNHLMSFAGRMRRDGAPQPRILTALAHENATTCDPPLDKAEVARIAASASRYPAGPGSSTIAEILEESGVAKLKGESLPAEREAVVERLRLAAAPLDRVRRALLREELIKRSGFSADLADAIVRQVAGEGTKQQGSAMLFKEVAPWDEPVDAALLLDEIVSTIVAFVVLPAHCSVAIALWILHTHALDAAQISPRLAIVSPEKRCGKSTVLKLLGSLVRRALEATNITAAVLFRSIEAHRPTPLVDEADTFLRDRDDLRGVLNAGHDRHSAKVLRCVGDDHEPRVFDVWAPVAFAGIGKQHDTLMDRSIVVSMKRRSAADEPVASFRRRQREALGDLHRKVAGWAIDNVERLRDINAQAPPGLDDRAADNWEALFAIADTAGAAWLERAHAASLALSGAERGGEANTHGEQLLADIRAVFNEKQVSAMPAKSLLETLLAMDERPWPEANRGRPLTPRQLGTRLGRFGIHSRTVRSGAATVRSYVKEDFQDAFSRYLAPLVVATGTCAKPLTHSARSELSHTKPVTDAVAQENAADLVGVTDVTDGESSYVAVERAAIHEFGS